MKYLIRPENDKRPEIFDAVEMILSRYLSGEKGTSINFPPRYGKTSVIHGSALELIELGAPTNICLCPWDFLAKQVKVKEKIKENFARYNVVGETFITHRCEARLKSHTWYELSNETIPSFLSMTVALAYINKGAFIDGIQTLHEQNGVRIPVYFDETHLAKTFQNWGKFVKEIEDAGGYIIALTGTPVPGIHGFNERPDEWKTKKKKIIKRKIVEDEMKWFKETGNSHTRKLDIKADIEVGWGKAWEAGELAHVNAIWIDADIIDKTDEKFIGKLSELKKSQLNGQLKKIIEDETNTAKAADAAVDRLLDRRKRNPNTQMLVVTGFDQGERDSNNYHAREYKRALTNALSSKGVHTLKIEIATGITESGEPDDDSINKLETFRNGGIDILIVKMMGLVGLDRPELKVMIFASPIRNGPLFKQAISRPLTKWRGLNADIIMFQDRAMIDSYDEIITNQGGAFEKKWEFLEEEEIPPPEESQNILMSQNPDIVQYSDDHGQTISGNFEIILMQIKKKFPFVEKMTDVEILKIFQSGGFPLAQEEIDKKQDETNSKTQLSGVVDLDENLRNLEGRFGREAKKIVGKYLKYGQSPKEWVSKLKELQKTAKRECGVLSDLEDIDDSLLLERLLNALKEAEKEVFRKKDQ